MLHLSRFFIRIHDTIKWNFRTPKPPIDSLGRVIFEELESLVKEESSGDEGEGEKNIYIYIYVV